ncbi:hypothetical protein D9M73_178400 [compost metagenome]
MGTGGEIAQAIKVVLRQSLTVQLVNPVARALLTVAATVEPAIGQGRPVTQAALPLQCIAAAGDSAIIDQVELVTHQQAVAALFGKPVITLAGR